MLTFRRLLGFLRPYRRAVVVSFMMAAGAMGATVLIPYLTGRAIDSIRSHDRHTLTVQEHVQGGRRHLTGNEQCTNTVDSRWDGHVGPGDDLDAAMRPAAMIEIDMAAAGEGIQAGNRIDDVSAWLRA